VNIEEKIVSRQLAQRLVRQWKDQGKEVVFTNGCFDILHFGHIKYLEEAKTLGDKLVIGLNSDASTRRLKGDLRPINVEYSRAYLLASLECVDLVMVFEEDTPEALIDEVRPDVLVKGGDYKAEDVVGGAVVKELGGKVIILPFQEGYSTTSNEDKILSLRKANGD